MHKKNLFSHFAHKAGYLFGQPVSFFVAVFVVVIWLVMGPMFHYSDTWQLVINTGTTILTFLMVFLIQNTQNRDGAAIQIKLDELIRAIEQANNSLLDLENLPQEELEKLRNQYLELARKAHQTIEKKKNEES